MPIPVYCSSLIPKMLMFMLAISCLTTFNLPWFMDLTLQVPMQYCSLQHRTLLPSPVTSTNGCCFCFGSVSSFFLELSPLFSSSILGTYQPGEFIFQCHILLPFHTTHESFKKTSTSALLTMPKPLTVWITINCGKFWKRWEHQTTWPASWETYMQVRKQQLELDMEQQTGSK